MYFTKYEEKELYFPVVYIAIGLKGQSQHGHQSLPVVPIDYYGNFLSGVLLLCTESHDSWHNIYEESAL